MRMLSLPVKLWQLHQPEFCYRVRFHSGVILLHILFIICSLRLRNQKKKKIPVGVVVSSVCGFAELVPGTKQIKEEIRLSSCKD